MTTTGAPESERESIVSETIPEDVRNIANSIAWDLPSRVARLNREFASNVIARAILAERVACTERCAEVAGDAVMYCEGMDITRAARHVVAAIRGTP